MSDSGKPTLSEKEYMDEMMQKLRVMMDELVKPEFEAAEKLSLEMVDHLKKGLRMGIPEKDMEEVLIAHTSQRLSEVGSHGEDRNVFRLVIAFIKTCMRLAKLELEKEKNESNVGPLGPSRS